MHFSADIYIGFPQQVYEFVEPQADFEQSFTNVTIVKAAGRQSEQTFSVALRFGDPPEPTPAALLATEDNWPNYDYRIGAPGVASVNLTFPPDKQSLCVEFFLSGDVEMEGLKGFLISLERNSGSPKFRKPNNDSLDAYESTEVLIIDDDCKYYIF